MPAVKMQCHLLRVIALLAAVLTACASSEVRIDGTSPEAFAQSHRKLMQSLSLSDQARLTVAEIVICTAATPKPSGPAPALPPPMVPLVAVRSQLNGKTFAEILQYSKSLDAKVNVGFVVQPSSNNRSRGP
jgi:hypothetical protein